MRTIRACLTLLALPAPCFAGEPYWPDGGQGHIKTWDGTDLHVYWTEPLTIFPDKKFPLVIWTNSWTVPGFEYIAKNIAWATRGYICVEYTARGWWDSGGKIDVAGENTLKDAQSVIDWALKKFGHADPYSIGMGGISYGSVVSQLVAARDPRIKAVFAMSGTSNAYEDFNWQHTPNSGWGKILVESGGLVGREEPYIKQLYNDVTIHKNMTWVKEWSLNRSMVSYIDQINSNNPAFYMSHQHEDGLFKSNVELDAFNSLKVTHKKLDMNIGTHASAELLGTIGIKIWDSASDHIWHHARLWADRFLKNVTDNGVENWPMIEFQIDGHGALMNKYEPFTEWPPQKASWSQRRLFMGARGAGGAFGTLAPTGGDSGVDGISFSDRDIMTTPNLGILEKVKIVAPVYADLTKVDPKTGIVYMLGSSPGRVCGAPAVRDLRLRPSSKQFQVVFYLYDVDEHNVGSLMAHGARTVWAEEGAEPDTLFDMPPVAFHTVCWDVPQGHRLALGLDMYDQLYTPADRTASLFVEYSSQPHLELPVVAGGQGSDAASSVIV